MKIPDWHPNHPSIYDIKKTYADNAQDGPFFEGAILDRPQKEAKFELFGFPLLSPLGVPAGPLLNSRWISLASRLGFDVLVYKTIRSFAHPGHGLPNMLHVEPIDQMTARVLKEPLSLDTLTVTNSFGMPSKAPDFLLQDIDRANRLLQNGQLLIVSVVGTPNQGVSFAQDFVRAAMLAREAGAKVIEANFSCPNVGKAECMLYTDPEAVYTFAKAIASAIHPVPLILKMGHFSSRQAMREVLLSAARAGAKGICGVNSMSMRVVDEHGHPALGESRPTSGVCGAQIRKDALDFIRDAASVIQSEKLNLTLLGCGGIVQANHFDEFLLSGAHIAMSAVGMMWDPYLALRNHWKTHVSTKPHPAAL